MPVEAVRRGGQDNKLAVCVKAMYGRVGRPRLVEWMELIRLLGVSLVGIYVTPSIHPDTRRTLDHYVNTSLVELRAISYLGGDGKSGGGHSEMLHMVAINDCVYRHMYSHRFIAVFDVDEVRIRHAALVTRQHEQQWRRQAVKTGIVGHYECKTSQSSCRRRSL